MGFFARFARTPVPAELRALLQADEQVLALAEVENGRLAVTRYGIWLLLDDQDPHRVGWQTLSKAHWDGRKLALTVADVVGELGGAQLIVDRPRLILCVVDAGKVTDIIHTRTRSAVAKAAHHDLPGGSGWLVHRRTPGRNGLTVQLRLDPGTDPQTPGLAEAVAALVAAAEDQPGR